ncbi:hypothetical protein FB558_5376 [Pseudonocardia kunmingensis]|uniref:Uncharacterized protein n=1 Tax=Pseudonocardia kunmingensis TaxID=630975 RepID=A0A543DJW2_9PSEU|nr:hypothetical protein FB558_5376 [Pseudonocardia kunmingensis]
MSDGCEVSFLFASGDRFDVLAPVGIRSRPCSLIQETKVWKKAGIVVAASFAAVLALGPVAYADTPPEGVDRADDAEQVITGDDAPQDGLLNLGDLNLLNGVNVCPDVTAAVGLGNVLGILGAGSSDPSAADAPLSCETSATREK